MSKPVMVKCAEEGCNRLVFPEQRRCWEHKLKWRDAKIAALMGRGKRRGKP